MVTGSADLRGIRCAPFRFRSLPRLPIVLERLVRLSSRCVWCVRYSRSFPDWPRPRPRLKKAKTSTTHTAKSAQLQTLTLRARWIKFVTLPPGKAANVIVGRACDYCSYVHYSARVAATRCERGDGAKVGGLGSLPLV